MEHQEHSCILIIHFSYFLSVPCQIQQTLLISEDCPKSPWKHVHKWAHVQWELWITILDAPKMPINGSRKVIHKINTKEKLYIGYWRQLRRRIFARIGLHGHIAAQKPALNKRQLRNRVAYTKAHSLTEGWTAEKWQFIFRSKAPPILSTTLRGPSGPTVHPKET